MRIIAYPANGYYARLFYAELQRQKVPVVEGDWSGRWMRRNVTKKDVVHIHWPSFYYRPEGSTVEIVWGFFHFMLLLFYLWWRCRSIVWTAHNLFPHERCRIPVIDVWVRWLVIRLSSIVVVHGREAKKILVARFPIARSKCLIIPFGNWSKAYPPPLSKKKARTKLGLPDDACIFLSVGRCRPYKNIEALVTQFRKVAGANDRLIIAGAFSSKEYLSEVLSASGKDYRVKIVARFLKPFEISEFVSACDVICAPYKDILTSGTAMLALTFGRPVVSINRGFLRDLITPSSGILVEPHDNEKLADALRAIKRTQWDNNAIRLYAGRFRHEVAAAKFRSHLLKLYPNDTPRNKAVQAVEGEAN